MDQTTTATRTSTRSRPAKPASSTAKKAKSTSTTTSTTKKQVTKRTLIAPEWVGVALFLVVALFAAKIWRSHIRAEGSIAEHAQSIDGLKLGQKNLQDSLKQVQATSSAAMVSAQEAEKISTGNRQVIDDAVRSISAAKADIAEAQGQIAALRQDIDTQTASIKPLTEKIDQHDVWVTQMSKRLGPQSVEPPKQPQQGVPGEVFRTPAGNSTLIIGEGGRRSTVSEKWRSISVAAGMESPEFSAKRARQGKIRIVQTGRTTLTQILRGGWNSRERIQESIIPSSGTYQVFDDAESIVFRSDEDLVIWERLN